MYIIPDHLKGLDVYCDKGKIALNDNTTQADLKYLKEEVHYQAIIKVEDKPKKKK